MSIVKIAGDGGQVRDKTWAHASVRAELTNASPEEVELEVTDLIEIALQQVPQLDFLESTSAAGLSTIKVNIKAEFWSAKLPQIWDEVRRKVNDVAPRLPPGAGPPTVNDHFGAGFVKWRAVEISIQVQDLEAAQLEQVLHLPAVHIT